MRKQSALLTVFVSLVLSGCTGLKTQTPAPTYFLLHPAPAVQEEQESLALSLVVEKPEIASGLNTDKIALFTNNRRELDYFAQARWNGHLDDILQDFIIESFENGYKNIEVDSSDIHQKADYKIITKVRDFQAEYDGTDAGPPLLRVTIVMSAVKLPKETVTARIKLERTVPASANTLTAVTNGLEELLQQTLDEALPALVGKN